MRPAVFLDRDGTVIEEVHYIADPSQVRLLDGAAAALRELRDAGFACVLVSNQSAVGRGRVMPAQVEAVAAEVSRQLACEGASVDGWYWCPVAPGPAGEADRTLVEHPDRKPGPGMLQRAARELGLDLSRSFMVGDMLSDLLAGRNAGVRGTVLVRTGHGARAGDPGGAADHVTTDLAAAARWILGTTTNGRETGRRTARRGGP